MCGIIGVAASSLLGDRVKVAEMITRSLKSLEYRGYDSVGIAMIDSNRDKIIVKKSDGMLDQVARRYNFTDTPGFVGIGHTRWATHGSPTQINAHPQVDCREEIAIVHNGIIKNFLELKKMLHARGHIFRSETDTEVVAHLIEELSKNNDDFFKAFRKAVSMLEGSYAIAVIYRKEPKKIFFARKESPLIVGVAKEMNFLASDIPAMLEYTNAFIPLSDGELGWISPEEVHIESLNGEKVDVSRRLLLVEWKSEMVRKGGYPHFMIKEIHEQPQVLKSTYDGLMSDDILDRAADVLAKGERIFVTAAGTSFHASLLLKLYVEMLTGKIVYPFIASEYKTVGSLARKGDIIIAVSQSGETIDTMKAMRTFKERGAIAVSITNVMGSTIGRESDFTIPMRAGPEIGVAATKTFLTQALVASLLSIKLAAKVGKIT
ncbi:MAG: glutamine--fructose-6-phosphate transaminase (isomerizing), partial [Fervidicoccaceae archaeon]